MNTSARYQARHSSGADHGRAASGLRRVLTVSAIGVAAAVVALGGATSAFAASTSGNGSPGPGGGGGQFPGASGTIAAINGTSLEVQNTETGQTTVTYTPTTTFQQTVSVNASAVTAGTCITATGKPTATTPVGTRRFRTRPKPLHSHVTMPASIESQPSLPRPPHTRSSAPLAVGSC